MIEELLNGQRDEDLAALVEIGHQQAEPVSAIAQAAGLSVTLHRDLAGRPRVLEMVHCETISLGKAGAQA